MCALQCLGQKHPAAEARPFVQTATGDLATAFSESGDSTADDSLRDGSSDLHKLVDTFGSDDHRRRVVSSRTARSARRAVVAIEMRVRAAFDVGSENRVHRRPDSRKDSSWRGPAIVPQQEAQPSITPAANSPLALSRSAPTAPTWMPTSCGTPGSTCGGASSGSGSGTVTERGKGAAGQRGFASSPPLRPIKREAESQPLAEVGQLSEHPPGWVPTTCGYPGATCGGIGDAGSGGTVLERKLDADRKGLASSLPPSHATKRDAESHPVAEARPLADHSPGWTPSPCTNRGITCGRAKTGTGSGGDHDGTADVNAGSGPPASYND